MLRDRVSSTAHSSLTNIRSKGGHQLRRRSWTTINRLDQVKFRQGRRKYATPWRCFSSGAASMTTSPRDSTSAHERTRANAASARDARACMPSPPAASALHRPACLLLEAKATRALLSGQARGRIGASDVHHFRPICAAHAPVCRDVPPMSRRLGRKQAASPVYAQKTNLASAVAICQSIAK